MMLLHSTLPFTRLKEFKSMILRDFHINDDKSVMRALLGNVRIILQVGIRVQV